MAKVTVQSQGGRGGARRSRAQQTTSALLGRLRRLELLVISIISPRDVSHLTDRHIQALIASILDAHRGYDEGEEVQVPRQGPADGQGERNA